MSTFDKLAPFIQDYIYRHKWQELHEIQVAACDVIFNTDNNLLISTPTASGKTEAAFLPIITEIYNKPSSSVGILYIAPLKALINDQFVRIEELLDEAYIPVTKWHGDASQTAKNRLLRKPQGVLQITPESLEAMLMKRKQSVIALFSDLRFIIVDEVHNFIASDRGIQLTSVLERIQNLANVIPRRVGLSATLGDISVAEEWLSKGTQRSCDSPAIGIGRRKAQIMLNHFYTNAKKTDDESWISYYDFLYSITCGRKSIIFSNSRGEVETNINRLKILAGNKKDRDVFHVHHGNISADSREYTEEQMRTSDTSVVTGATVTLELGIDLGDLERIVQTGSPHSVSSLAQRLGRSGRRSGISQMCFVFNEDMLSQNRAFYKAINWQFIKCIALIELYRENWLEPLRISKFPYNILVHQTMSILYSYGDVSPEILAQKLLSIETFYHIGQDDFKTLLRYMLDVEMIEKTQEGKILIGKKGEWLTNNYEFYSVFENVVEYAVREDAREIGTLYQTIPVGERFVLSGRTWEVIEVDDEKKVIYVKFVGGKSTINWTGNIPGETHTKVLQKMREVMVSNDEYGYLHHSAATRLSEIRNTIRQIGIFAETHQADVFSISPNSFGLFPWLGTRALNALKFAMQSKGIEITDKDSNDILLIVSVENVNELKNILKNIKTSAIDIETLPIPKEPPYFGKYSDYVPPILAYKQYIDNFIDINEMQKELYLEVN